MCATKAAGRPRDPQADQAILDAATELLIEVGFGRLSVDTVASRAGVGKATIYRRWRSKTELLRAALGLLPEPDASSDAGDLRSDLKSLLAAEVANFVESDAGDLMPQLIAEAHFDPELRGVLHAKSQARRAVVRQVLERAQQRGELRDGLDLEVAIDMVTAPIFIRRLITDAPITPEATDEAVEILIRGIT